MISIGCLISLTSVLNYSQIISITSIISFYFLMNLETTSLQQSVIFNLYSIAKCNKHLFNIILIIHIFAIFHRATDIYFFHIHLFCFGIKIVKQCFFFLLLQYSIKISYISTLPLIFIIFTNVIS